MLNSLLVRGTPEGVDKFEEFLKLIDKKPQQILIEIQSYTALLTAGKPSGTATSPPPGEQELPEVVVLGDAAPIFDVPFAHPTDSIRVATMNLMTACNTVRTGPVEGKVTENQISITPRINGDGTLTLNFGWKNSTKTDRAAAATLAYGTVTVHDGETVALVRRKDHTTIVVTPRIVKETPLPNPLSPI